MFVLRKISKGNVDLLSALAKQTKQALPELCNEGGEMFTHYMLVSCMSHA